MHVYASDRGRWASRHESRNSFIVLDQEDAEFIMDELSACAPRDGFTREFTQAVIHCWPEPEKERDEQATD